MYADGTQHLGMIKSTSEVLWANMGAAIDMLRETVAMCPHEQWVKEKKFFYLTYHTTIFLDYYLASPVASFQPALSYTLVSPAQQPPEAIDDVVPNRHYHKLEVLDYLSQIREKAEKRVRTLTDDQLKDHWIQPNEIHLHGLCPSVVKDYSVLEILLYNLRHVQHHVGQLNLILREKINDAPQWIAQA